MKTENESEFDKKNVWGGKNKSIDPEQKDTDVTQSERMDQQDKDEMQRLSLETKRGVETEPEFMYPKSAIDKMNAKTVADQAEITSLRAENERLKKELENKGNSIC